jgi:PAS domain S-box-containing protein
MSQRRRPTDDAAIQRLDERRRAVIGRAVHVLELGHEMSADVPSEDVQPEALRETVALLTISLEELRVAEEELVQQNEELMRTREAIEASSRHFRRLFDTVPAPYVVTDICGIIRHANHAATVLFKRSPKLLEGKPLLSFVPLDRRSGFREAINRLQIVDEVHDWRVTLMRHGDGPVPVTIDVQLSRGAHRGEELICWLLRPAVAVPQPN